MPDGQLRGIPEWPAERRNPTITLRKASGASFADVGMRMSNQSDRWIATARLLRCTGFGTTGRAVDALVDQDVSAYLDRVLSADPDADPGAMATPMPPLVGVPAYPGAGAPRAAQDAWNKLVDDQMLELSRWWLHRMVAVHEPIHEKLTLVWHNHFATSATKVRYANYMGVQNITLRSLKLGPFRDLAYAMLTGAAMLVWLDGIDNVASSPNENLSREFMELFALGHGGGYTEADVKNGARALTGWMADPHAESAIRPDEHDEGLKTVLGVTGALGANQFCDVVLAHPSSEPYVAARLWQQLASDTMPSPDTLRRLRNAYAGGDLRALTKAIVLDPEFETVSSVVTPVDWLVGVLRTLSVRIENDEMADPLLRILESLGQVPFYPPDVSGWPRGRVWVSTGSVAVQAWAAGELAKRGDLAEIEEAAPSERVDAVGYFIGVGAWSDRSAQVLRRCIHDPRQLFAAAVSTPEYLTV